MIEWFDQRYISRDEHQEIVAFYRKLVAQLHGNVRELRSQVAGQEQSLLQQSSLLPENGSSLEKLQPPIRPDPQRADNVIRFDFRRRF